MDVIVDNGSSVTFTCEVFSYIPTNLTWLHNGELLDEDSTTIITTANTTDPHVNTTTLMILNVQLPDSGSYVCSATNREGTTLSNTAMLSVIGKLLFCFVCMYVTRSAKLCNFGIVCMATLASFSLVCQ